MLTSLIYLRSRLTTSGCSKMLSMRTLSTLPVKEIDLIIYNIESYSKVVG